MDEKLEYISKYEMYGGNGILIDDKPFVRVLVGGYTRGFEEYHLNEIYIWGDKVKITGEWVIKDAKQEEGKVAEIMACRLMDQSIGDRDIVELLDSLQ